MSFSRLPPSVRRASPSTVASSSKLFRQTIQTSAYVPSGAQPPLFDPVHRPLPSHKAYYAGLGHFSNAMVDLEIAITQTKAYLHDIHLWPKLPSMVLPSTITRRPSPIQDKWIGLGVMRTQFLEANLKETDRARMTALCAELTHLQEIGEVAGQEDVVSEIKKVLKVFARKSGTEKYSQEKEVVEGEEANELADATTEVSEASKMKEVELIDQYGRSSGRGYKKLSKAQAWIIPTSQTAPILNPPHIQSLLQSNVPSPSSPIELGQILINQLPLHHFFKQTHEREAVLRPFKLTGLIGAFNVFAVVDGPILVGKSKADAVAMAIANALVKHQGEKVQAVLDDALLTVGDRRHRLRKNTNMRGHNAANRWVKR